VKAAAKRDAQAANAAVPTNLPRYLTSFVGRRGELNALKSLLERSRMVTLSGPGGAGKSRLAAELGHALLILWPDGAWWAALAPVNDPRHVPGAVVTALELRGQGSAQDVAIAWLTTRRTLLVLDNCEHLVAACAEFCQAALERCPELTIMATSREALGVPGETRWAVASLPAHDAVQLFEARARLVVPAFRVTEPNLETVSQICERLDGMPLAIELAAARAGMMTEREILAQLSDRFGLLTGGNRTAPERHQTMIATIDWSYRLLTKGEALLFRRLSVFRGGFQLDGVMAVCADGLGGSTLDLLGGLEQKSMVVAERSEGSASRYRLLETQLAYAEDRLRETRELVDIRRRHYEYFLDCLGAKVGPPATPPPTPGADAAAWIAREWGNLWTAVGWARDNADDLGLPLAVRLAQSNFPDINAMRRLMTDLLDRSQEGGVLRMRALVCASNLANRQGDYDAALSASVACLALARETGDADSVASALLTLGHVQFVRRDFDSADDALDEAIALVKGSSNLRLISAIRNNLAFVAVDRGDYASARDILVECVATSRAQGEVSLLAAQLDSLAWALLGLDDRQEATAAWNESLSLYRSVLDGWGMIWCVHGLSSMATANADHKRALRLMAAAARLSQEGSYEFDSWVPANAGESHLRSRSKLGAGKSEEAWAQGWAMTLDQVIEYALGKSEPRPAADAGPLSRREREVATLVARGYRNRDIAERLTISKRTVDAHVEHIRNKLGHQSRAEVAAWVTARGLIKN
jgi:predicted ATPase/DNA-binding NarL/FixJ family response regulator